MNSVSYSRRSFLAAISLTAALPARAEEPKIDVPGYNRMSDEQEIALGREAAQGIEKERHLHFLESHQVRNYVGKVFMRITESSRRPHFPYQIKVVDTKEINAYALPGGFVYLTRGVLEWAQSESELVATLAHEVGHVAAHHSANAFARVSSADSLLTEASKLLLGDPAPARVLEAIGGPVASLALLKYDRTQELDADLLGFYNMQRAGWDPIGMLQLFRRFSKNESVLDPLFTLTCDHPASSERESQIRQEIRRTPPRTGLISNTDEFSSMQSHVKRLALPAVRTKLSPEGTER